MDVNSIEVASTPQRAFARIKGRGDFLNSQALKDFIVSMMEKGITDFFIDLKECKTMDSTFMGVLAGTALQIKNKHQKKLTLFHVEEHNLKLLTTLGIHIFLSIITEEPTPPIQFEELLPAQTSKDKIAKEMLNAHAVLMDLSEENRIKFRDVYEYLKDEIKKGP